MDIGSRLKEMRKEKGLTQQQLCEKLHVSRQLISKWETNNSLPDIHTLLLLASIYHVTLQELIGEENQIFNQTDVLNESEKIAVLHANEERRKEEMFTKNAKKFIVVLASLCVLLLAYNLGQEWYFQRQVKKMALPLYGVEKVVYENKFTLTGADYPVLISITLDDGMILEEPTIYEIEALGLTKKTDDEPIYVGPPMIIDYFDKYPHLVVENK